MTNEKQTDDGGAAFPHLNPNYDGLWDKNPQRGGLSMRDYFAAAALQGVIATCIHQQITLSREEAAMNAYKAADAMLQARKEAQ